MSRATLSAHEGSEATEKQVSRNDAKYATAAKKTKDRTLRPYAS